MDPVLANITIFAGNFAPLSYAFCNGALLSIAENTALFSLIGTTYGGDGQTTFALPDLRGRSPKGTGQGPGLSPCNLGEVSGLENTVLISSNLANHTHTATASFTMKVNANAGGAASPSGNTLGPSGQSVYAPTSSGAQMAVISGTATSGIAGGSVPFSNMMPYLALNFIIAVEGIYPSRN